MVKENKKARFNIIDLVIVLFVILAAAGIVYRYNLADRINLNANSETFEIEFFIGNIMSGTEDYLYPGEKFYINTESIEIGTVKEILDVRDAVTYVAGLEGDLTKSYLPGRVDVTGIMTSKGRTTKEGYMVNGNIFVAEGKEFLIHTGKRECTITVMSIKPVS
jgi:hypothetical protein